MITKKDLKQKIEKCVQEAQEDMFLQNWDIIVYYDNKIDSVGQCERDREYLRAWITFNLDKVFEDYKTFKENSLKSYCYHEVAHILIKELEFLATCRYIGEEEISTERERLTESIARIILKLKK